MSVTNQIPDALQIVIAERLDEIEKVHDVRVLFAIESGSRAWGFPSPDSDYDVRFVYVHTLDWYLSIDSKRDVIEMPIDGDLDINGWDLKKALQLLIKPNAVLLEWLRSPIVYRSDERAINMLSNLGEHIENTLPSTYHYLHLADSQYRRFIDGKDSVSLKKYFYALRPALSLLWLRTRSDSPLPMNLQKLIAGLDIPEAVQGFIDELVIRKSRTKELGNGPRIPELDRLIESEVAIAKSGLKIRKTTDPSLIDKSNRVFQELVLQTHDR